MSSPESILVVSPYRIEYGPPQTLEHVARALVGAGYRPVCVVPPGARITDQLQELEPTIRILDGLATFPRTLNAARLANFFDDHFAASRKIERIAVEEQAKAIYSISEAIFAGSLAAKRLDLPSLVHVIGMSIQTPRWGGNVYVRFLDRLTDQFVACSSAVAEMLASYGVRDEKIIVVHNGIAVAEVEATENAASPTSHDGPKIGVVAAYDPRKGHELFIEAAALVGKRYPFARFYLIGGILEGQPDSLAFKQRVEALIRRLGLEAQVETTGFVPPPQVYEWIRAMDVVVVPSRTEAFAHALLEAMVCGKAVVATGIEGNLDAFVHGHSGLYVKPAPEPLAEAVCELLADPARAAALGAAARERAKLFFDLGITLPAIGHTVDYLLGSAPRRLDGARPPLAEPGREPELLSPVDGG